jgi:DNA primase
VSDRFDDGELQKVIEGIDLEDWLTWEAISFKRVGGGSNLRLQYCPFCGDSRNKVFFHREKKQGLCFHGDCQAKFNLFTFARQHLGTNNRGVIQHLKQYARQAGVIRARPVITEPVVADGWELPESIPLPTPEGMTHPMLITRKITLDTQALFGLRWCEEGRWTYNDGDGVTRQQIFDQRIIIPVHDLDGTVKSFQGRDGTGKADKRYLFPATLPGTGRFLYGAHLVDGRSHLVLGEGPFDVMATHQAISGHPDYKDVAAVGVFGLSVSTGDREGANDQLARLLQLKQRGVRRLTFLRDGEPGAYLASIKDGEALLKHGFEIGIGLLPQDCDPNEVDTAIVRRAIEEAQTLTPLTALAMRLNCPYK